MLVDTNVFITAYQTFYAFDLAPSFWEQFSASLEKQNALVLDMVKDELLAGNDDLAKWYRSLNSVQICSSRLPEIVIMYAEVLKYIQTSNLYTEKALRMWSGTVADPWLIAAAAVNDYTIITFEAPTGGLNSNTPSSKPKIPDVARAFGVECQNLYYLMRQAKIKL